MVYEAHGLRLQASCDATRGTLFRAKATSDNNALMWLQAVDPDPGDREGPAGTDELDGAQRSILTDPDLDGGDSVAIDAGAGQIEINWAAADGAETAIQLTAVTAWSPIADCVVSGAAITS